MNYEEKFQECINEAIRHANSMSVPIVESVKIYAEVAKAIAIYISKHSEESK